MIIEVNYFIVIIFIFLQHSRKHAAKAAQGIYDTLREELTRQASSPLPGTGRRSPYSLIADKYTPNRRTLDITGANVYLNGKMETVYLDGSVVKDHSAKGIADLFYKAAEVNFKNGDADIDWKKR